MDTVHSNFLHLKADTELCRQQVDRALGTILHKPTAPPPMHYYCILICSNSAICIAACKAI